MIQFSFIHTNAYYLHKAKETGKNDISEAEQLRQKIEMCSKNNYMKNCALIKLKYGQISKRQLNRGGVAPVIETANKEKIIEKDGTKFKRVKNRFSKSN